jgi:hypothetical protein
MQMIDSPKKNSKSREVTEAKMKRILYGISLVLILSVAALAQKNKDAKQVVDPSDKEANQKSQKVLLQSGTNLEAQLESTLDAKNAKVGDEVVLKTTKSIKQDGETIVPKGTNLIGRITEVQQKSKNKGSRIGMIFDRIEGKNLAAPISASIVAITNSTANVGDVFSSSSSSSTSSSGGTSSGSSGGGLLGGVTSTVGGVVNTTTGTVGGVANTAGQTLGGATQPVGTLSGIQISKSVSGSANSSTTLSAADKNVRLEKGTTFHLQLNKSVQN